MPRRGSGVSNAARQINTAADRREKPSIASIRSSGDEPLLCPVIGFASWQAAWQLGRRVTKKCLSVRFSSPDW